MEKVIQMDQENRYWQNKVFINSGILRTFQQDYDKISTAADRFVTASQLYPTDETLESEDKMTKSRVYEYIIYYKVKPEGDTREVNKQTGKVETKPEVMV